MDVSRISPAPSASTRWAHADGVDARGGAAAVDEDLEAVTIRAGSTGRALASMATTTHWEPNSVAISETSSGRSTAAEFTDTLSAPARSSRRASSTVRMPPPMVKGMNTSSAVRAGHLEDGVAGVGRGGDVEEHDLVGALAVVAGGQLDRVAGIDQVDEVDALDDAAGVDVEAGDDSGGPHDVRLRGGLVRSGCQFRYGAAASSPGQR